MGFEVSRRTFLKGAVIAAAGFNASCDVSARDPVPTDPTPRGDVLALPRGFRQRVLSRRGQPLPRAGSVAGKHDGMTAFAYKGDTLLVRNHEQLPDADFPVRGQNPFDADDAGGVTAVVVSADREPIREFTLLSGTRRNCAGGSTPWGTWLTCEEIREDNHGFVFEVLPEAGENDLSKLPIRSMGQFRHEAVGVDPRTGIVYLTEDAPPRSFVYRFLPSNLAGRPGALQEGGRLQAMRLESDIVGEAPTQVGTQVKVGWVDVDVTAAPESAADRGAVPFHKLEGALHADGLFWFPDTDGGAHALGQIFRYSPEDETLELFFEAQHEDEMQKPDNLAMTPWGDLWFVEDGKGFDRVMGLTPAGAAYEFARNQLNESELSGPCFSPDGRTFFVNIYDPGITVAVWGPFERWSANTATAYHGPAGHQVIGPPRRKEYV
ncbi:MAG: alkaline phosphatase PhoX [Actinomycetota bacterium]